MPAFKSFLVNLVKSPSAAAQNTVQPTSAAVVPLTIKSAAAQSADLLKCVSSADANIFRIASDGAIDIQNGNIGISSGGSITLNHSSAGYIDGVEQASDPAAPSANRGRLYFKDNGAGKTQLVVRFNTGAVQVISTEP